MKNHTIMLGITETLDRRETSIFGSPKGSETDPVKVENNEDNPIFTIARVSVSREDKTHRF